MSAPFQAVGFDLVELLSREKFPAVTAVGPKGTPFTLQDDPQRIITGNFRLLQPVRGGVLVGENYLGTGRMCSLYTEREVGGTLEFRVPSHKCQASLRRGRVDVKLGHPFGGSLLLVDGAEGHGSLTVQLGAELSEIDLEIETEHETGLGDVTVLINGDRPEDVEVLGLPAQVKRIQRERPTLRVYVSSSLCPRASDLVANQKIGHAIAKHGHPYM